MLTKALGVESAYMVTMKRLVRSFALRAFIGNYCHFVSSSLKQRKTAGGGMARYVSVLGPLL